VLRLAGFAHDRGACTTLRIRQPIERIKELGLAETEIVERKDDHTEDKVLGSNVVILGRAASEQTLFMVRKCQELGKKVVFDLDDNMYDVSVMSPHYQQLGTMPVNFENPDGSTGDVWIDGERGFDVKRNRKLRISFIRLMRQADYVTVTTPPLANVYRRFNDNVKVIPNALNYRIWDKPNTSYNGNEVRLLYTGAANHFEDWLFVHPVLKELQDKHKNLKIVLIGTDWKHSGVELDYSRVEVHRWIDYESYPYLLKSLACHIGIAPIRESDFNDCRSELKWVEHSSLMVASVCSRFGPYKRSVRDGETGILATEPKEWFQALSALITKKELRRKLSENAYKDVRKNFNLDFTVDTWMDVFRETTQKGV
jgi:glycosyltransferase involved in cell wall biosynthesis